MRIKFAAENSPNFTNPSCLGDQWGIDLITFTKEGLKQITHANSKVVVKAAYSRLVDAETPHDFYHQSSKKYANQVRIAAKRMVSGRYTPMQLLNWKESQSSCLKDHLDHILEILAYKFDKEPYLNSYCKSFGFYGMSREDAEKRFEEYHTDLLKRDYVADVYNKIKYWGKNK